MPLTKAIAKLISLWVGLTEKPKGTIKLVKQFHRVYRVTSAAFATASIKRMPFNVFASAVLSPK